MRVERGRGVLVPLAELEADAETRWRRRLSGWGCLRGQYRKFRVCRSGG